jgi:hypothetical protein
MRCRVCATGPPWVSSTLSDDEAPRVCPVCYARFLAACPGLHILATSREPLRVPTQATWRVPHLAAPDRSVGGSPPGPGLLSSGLPPPRARAGPLLLRGGRPRCRNGPELLQHPELVELDPGLHDRAVRDAIDVDAADHQLFARRG